MPVPAQQFVIKIAKPPALPGDSQSLTFPEVTVPFASATPEIALEQWRRHNLGHFITKGICATLAGSNWELPPTRRLSYLLHFVFAAVSG
jgi:hypothetical protein